ncbi:uncharacterized protein LOC141900054 [Tubulanus polymorphus]|uniref:uncharacterized protein LOC141900054 n=1 Tax=Tubulanus polymorphus TaxID=672921 RepID=UPI003DA219BA
MKIIFWLSLLITVLSCVSFTFAEVPSDITTEMVNEYCEGPYVKGATRNWWRWHHHRRRHRFRAQGPPQTWIDEQIENCKDAATSDEKIQSRIRLFALNGALNDLVAKAWDADRESLTAEFDAVINIFKAYVGSEIATPPADLSTCRPMDKEPKNKDSLIKRFLKIAKAVKAGRNTNNFHQTLGDVLLKLLPHDRTEDCPLPA